MALLYLSPALKDGASFGPADLGVNSSFLTLPGKTAPRPHNVINSDIIDQGVAWNTLDWRLVHDGQLPLWNDLSGNGLPLLLNFQAAPFALPTLVGYLFPLSLAFLVTVAMKLLIAGTGAYVLTRLLGGRVLSAALAGTTFMLSGSLAGWLGWSLSGTLAWAGWITAAAVLAYRGRGRWRMAATALLSLCVAFCVYGGFPEAYVLLAGGLAVLLVATGIATVVSRRRIDPRGLVRLGVGVAGGLALSSPLWLPGLAVIRRSVRSGNDVATGLPWHEMILILGQGYEGLPTTSAQAPLSSYFGPANYYETAAYVGVVALVLAMVALTLAWRRPAVAGLGAMAAATLLIVYDLGSGAPVQRLIRAVGLGSVGLQRMLPVLGLALAVLAGLGLEFVLARWRQGRIQVALIASVTAVGAVLAVLWARSGGQQRIPEGAKLPALKASSIHHSALLWPTAEVLALLAAALALPLLAHLSRSPGPGVGRADRVTSLAWAGIVGVQACFLVVAGIGINSYASVSYPVTPAVRTVLKLVGHQLLGIDVGLQSCVGAAPGQSCGVRSWSGFGFYPDINLGYGIAELAVHDPLTPKAYFNSWPVPNAGQAGVGPNVFAPSITSVGLARRYGVQYVLIDPDYPIPRGMQLVSTIRTDSGVQLRLAHVPSSGPFRFVPAPGVPVGAGEGRVISVSHPGDTTYRLHVEVAHTQRLAIRITNVPGWHATADGHPVALSRSSGDLLSALVPGGTTEVVLTYEPALLEWGWVLALAVLVVFVLVTAVPLGRGLGRRRRPRHRLEGAQPPR